GAFLIASLSIIGLPPLGGLWSKWYLGLGALEAGELFALAVLMLSSLLNIAYLLQIPLLAFFGRPAAGEGVGGIREAPLPCLIAIGLTAAASVGLFFLAEPVYELARRMLPEA